LSTPLEILRKFFNFKKILLVLFLTGSIVGLVLPNFSLAQEELPAIEAPETFEEAKELGEEFLKESKEQLPGILERLWKEEVLPVWRKMYEIWSNWWDNYIQPWLQNIWERIKNVFIQEIEKRRPKVKQELEKEKEELKEEIKKELPKTTKSLWERFKELIK